MLLSKDCSYRHPCITILECHLFLFFSCFVLKVSIHSKYQTNNSQQKPAFLWINSKLKYAHTICRTHWLCSHWIFFWKSQFHISMHKQHLIFSYVYQLHLTLSCFVEILSICAYDFPVYILIHWENVSCQL